MDAFRAQEATKNKPTGGDIYFTISLFSGLVQALFLEEIIQPRLEDIPFLALLDKA